jgi:hypothetical protein
MPESRLSSQAKPEVWLRIESLLGKMRSPKTNRRDWRISADGKVSVFVTFSKLHKESGNRYWYDLSQVDIEKWEQYEKAFIVFVMGGHEKVMVIPLAILQEEFRKMHISLSKGSKITLHIIPDDDGYDFRELPDLDVAPFYNNYAACNSRMLVKYV